MTEATDHRRSILIALMMCTALAALDATIVTTAVPSIVQDLGGFSLFPWLLSIYLLTQAVSTPIYGRFADIFGRKRVLFVAIAIFLLGSVLAGIAWNMESLIAFRALQGIGAGGIMPVVITILGDLYTVKERAKVQGYVASMWGMASVVGPLVGGSLTQYVSWRWIFIINVPIGIYAVVLISRRLQEQIEKRDHRIDYKGASTLIAGLMLLIFGLLQGGAAWAWTSTAEISTLALSAALLASFFFIERVVNEPMVPLWAISRRPLAAGNFANFVLGAAQFGFASYVPTFVQGVRQHGAIIGGLTVASMTIGWPIAAGYSGRLYTKIGFRNTAIIGSVISLIGAVCLVPLGQSASVFALGACGFVMGFGFGFCTNPILISLQSTVDWRRRGLVTGINIFSRTLGSAVGTAVLGSVANSSLAGRLTNPPRDVAGQLPHNIESVARILKGHSSLGVEATQYLRTGLYYAIHDVFIGTAILTALIIVGVLAMPKKAVLLNFSDDSIGDSPGAGGDGSASTAIESVIG